MNTRPSKAIVVGATSTMLFTIVVEVGVRSCGPGEASMSWLLMGPWFAIIAPGVLLARAFGFDANAGDHFDLPLFIFMLAVNGVIGAFFGWIIGSGYRLFKRAA